MNKLLPQENPQSAPVKLRMLRYAVKQAGRLSTYLICGFALYYMFNFVFPSPRELSLEHKLKVAEKQYGALKDQIDQADQVLNELQSKDQSIYGLLLGQEGPDAHVWNGGIGGHELADEEGSSYASLKQKLNQLERKLNLQEHFLSLVEVAAAEKELKLAHVPSIKPINLHKSDNYMRLLSGYGMRLHPVYKVMRMHKGMDFPGKKGTPIIATGAGVVKEVKRSRRGYGRAVVIDHGYDYTTLYGHLDKIHVKVGQKVERGEEIGTMGRTGTATATHLHYEVRYKGRPINPIDFCSDGLSSEEYNQLVENAQNSTYSFD